MPRTRRMAAEAGLPPASALAEKTQSSVSKRKKVTVTPAGVDNSTTAGRSAAAAAPPTKRQKPSNKSKRAHVKIEYEPTAVPLAVSASSSSSSVPSASAPPSKAATAAARSPRKTKRTHSQLDIAEPAVMPSAPTSSAVKSESDSMNPVGGSSAASASSCGLRTFGVVDIESLPDSTKPGPPHWREVYRAICVMRSSQVAPVDTMGCSSLANRDADPKTFRFQALVSLMLSSMTKDETTSQAVKNLQALWPDGLTVKNVIAAPIAMIDKAICKVGFHTKKASYMKQTAQILQDTYGGDIPPTVDDMIKLPGIGPKMAYLTMLVAWGKAQGIGVDTHVHRISNVLGWVKSKTPEETRKGLEQWLPHPLWTEINELFVGFGQTICFARNPRCFACKAAQWCPVGRKLTKALRPKGDGSAKAEVIVKEPKPAAHLQAKREAEAVEVKVKVEPVSSSPTVKIEH